VCKKIPAVTVADLLRDVRDGGVSVLQRILMVSINRERTASGIENDVRRLLLTSQQYRSGVIHGVNVTLFAKNSYTGPAADHRPEKQQERLAEELPPPDLAVYSIKQG
jgi:hypothetical protein